MKNDRLLRHDVAETLERELGLTPRFIGLEIHHGVVTLVGAVRSESEREAARRAAQRVDGVLRVTVDLAVRPDLVPPHANSRSAAA